MKPLKKSTQRIIKAVILSLLLPLFMACENDCDDCLDYVTKSIIVMEDETGNNLLFGPNAIYDPEDIVIKNANGELQDIFIDESTNSIQFSLLPDITTYTIEFSENEIDTLNFALATRKSDRCCGNITTSTETKLNSNQIENSNVITINK